MRTFEDWWTNQYNGAPTTVFNTEKDMAKGAWDAAVSAIRSQCKHDYINPRRVSKLTYACKHCGADITMEVILIVEDELDELKLHEDDD